MSPCFRLTEWPSHPGWIEFSFDGEGVVDLIELVVEMEGDECLIAQQASVERGCGAGLVKNR